MSRTTILACLLLCLGMSGLRGQEAPAATGARQSTALGLYGFSAMGGVDFEGSGRAIAAVGVDFGHLLTDRLRLRPSAEIGFLGSDNTYLLNFELQYRFVDDSHLAVPYVGTGLGLSGRDECGDDPGCPGLWLQFVLGFDMRIRQNVGWMLEFHPADALRRHRILIGLTTRRGS